MGARNAPQVKRRAKLSSPWGVRNNRSLSRIASMEKLEEFDERTTDIAVPARKRC
jgi:hypothetical protein